MMLRSAGLALAFLALGGCVRIRIHRTSTEPSIAETYKGTASSVLLGAIDLTKPFDIAEVCKNDWETITVGENTWQGALRFITLNNYIAWNVDVACTKAKPVVKDEWGDTK